MKFMSFGEDVRIYFTLCSLLEVETQSTKICSKKVLLKL